MGARRVDYDAAFLFGNGTSIPFGSPLGTEILARALDIASPHAPSGNQPNTRHAIRDPLQTFYSRISDIRRWGAGPISGLHLPVSHIFWNQWMNPSVPIEVATQARTMLLAYGLYWDVLHEAVRFALQAGDRIEPQFGLTPQQERDVIIGQLRGNDFDRMTELVAIIVEDSISLSPRPPAPHLMLAKAMAVHRNVLIVDLNYDPLWEDSLAACSDVALRYSFPPNVSVARLPATPPMRDRGNVVILKPHGSFHLLACQDCLENNGEERSLFYAQALGPLARHSGRSHGERRCPTCDAGAQGHFLIPYVSLDYAVRFRRLLELFQGFLQQEISRAKSIYAVGYGFQMFSPGRMFDLDMQAALNGRTVQVVSRTMESAEEICGRARSCGIDARSASVQGFETFAANYSP